MYILSALLLFTQVFSVTLPPKPDLQNDRFEIFLQPDHSWLIKEKSGDRQWHFRPDFTVLFAAENPGMAMRPAGIENVMYNVVTWKTSSLHDSDQIVKENIGQDVAGDGFDEQIIKGKTEKRTADIFKSALVTKHSATKHRKRKNEIEFIFSQTDRSTLSATLWLSEGNAFPSLRYTLKTKEDGFYSVGYTGAPTYELPQVSEIWQPMVWQEKRFPEKSFMTLAYQCPLPSTLVCANGGCVGVVADPKEFPFQPLPLLDNSRFGIALRTEEGKARSMLFAPALGGQESLMRKGADFSFEMRLFIGQHDLTQSFESIAREIYEFRDYRRNTTTTLNETLDNMLDYGMSSYSMFIDSLKGCAYSTDVPGAVKNVSALNPLQMALLTDCEDIFEKRAYPIMEFLISREKFLFTLDSTQKIQNPSRKMKGPVAPISELAALYQISGGKSKALLDLAKLEFAGGRTRNLTVEEKGDTWQNALALYQATGERSYLEKAVNGADIYLTQRISAPSENFELIEGGFFFWNGFTPDWINMLLLFEATGDQKYLDAARKGARQYTLFSWYSPLIPEDSVLVNPDNTAPHYWYLKRKGHVAMTVPEEVVPAWQVSEIGLTPESAGTCAGHRAIFMANYAPWMLRIGYLTRDTFLQQTAKAAIIGRYANFPGYHMNTARTTAYEKADYPLRPFKELSVNSFHFNHIWPHMSILTDYLITDAFVRSHGKITIPAAYIEGYAYLQSKFYGHSPGEFYGDNNIYPFMPANLLTTGSRQLNYLSFRGNGNFYIVFMNQADESVNTSVALNPEIFPSAQKGNRFSAMTWRNNKINGKATVEDDLKFKIDVPADGISAIRIEGLRPEVTFQDQLTKQDSRNNPGLIAVDAGQGRAVVLDFGKDLRTLYLYLQEDDHTIREAKLQYVSGKNEETLVDRAYPFEFTVPLSGLPRDTKFVLHITRPTGEIITENIQLSNANNE